MEIRARNVNDMLSEAMWKFKTSGVKVNTRNGKALVITEPVIMTYDFPRERVLFTHPRDANPIFHLMESLWILAGRGDVAFVSQFNSNIKNYSDDGIKFNAAYGTRMRCTFGDDQLCSVIEVLRKDPETRQAIVQLWVASDLTKTTKDKACNMIVVFSVNPVTGHLDMSVMNRSNDLWWGACGANAVHFSVLQEFVAQALNRPVGKYRQITNNLHIYTEMYGAMGFVENPSMLEGYNVYKHKQLDIHPLLNGVNWMEFLSDCEAFCDNPFSSRTRYKSSFIRDVAYPMAMISHDRKLGKLGMNWVSKIMADDWGLAASQWIERREAAKL